MNRLIALIAVAALFLMKKTSRSAGTGNWTANFSESEFIPAGDIGTIPATAVSNLKRLAVDVLQPAREKLGLPIKITSAYRNAAKNAAVGGSSSSQHLTGEAVDVQPVPNTAANAKRLWDILEDGGYDQMIWENAVPFNKPSHIHISYKSSGNRKKKYYMLAGNYYLM